MIPVVQSVVRSQPETGRTALFVGEHLATRLVDVLGDESCALLDGLFAHSVPPEHLYRHRWQPHDRLCWDKRSLMHLACACPADPRRRLNRTPIEGDAPH